MKRSLSVVNNTCGLFFILFCLFTISANGQGKVVIDKKPDATVTQNKPVKAKRVKGHISKHIKTQNPPLRKAYDSPSQDDKKLKEIKEKKARERGMK